MGSLWPCATLMNTCVLVCLRWGWGVVCEGSRAPPAPDEEQPFQTEASLKDQQLHLHRRMFLSLPVHLKWWSVSAPDRTQADPGGAALAAA